MIFVSFFSWFFFLIRLLIECTKSSSNTINFLKFKCFFNALFVVWSFSWKSVAAKVTFESTLNWRISLLFRITYKNNAIHKLIKSSSPNRSLEPQYIGALPTVFDVICLRCLPLFHGYSSLVAETLLRSFYINSLSSHNLTITINLVLTDNEMCDKLRSVFNETEAVL